MRIFRAIETPIRESLSTHQAWQTEDGGLVACWECGRGVALEQPQLAAAAIADELVPLPWKGGLRTTIKDKRKYGTMRYLAMWQGLRGENLEIDTTSERKLQCARFGVTVIFTADPVKYGNA